MKLLIFDIDGTLTATNNVDGICFIEALTKFFGFSYFDTNWKNYEFVTDSGIPNEIALKHWDRSLSESENNQLEEVFITHLKEHPASAFPPILGANKFIQFLKKSNDYEIALATGCWKSSAIHKLTQAQIDYSGIPIATSSDSHNREAIMDIARTRSLDYYGRNDFTETIYFGDAIWDVHACKNLNWRIIGIGEKISELEELGQKHVFKDYSSPTKIIEAIEAQQGIGTHS